MKLRLHVQGDGRGEEAMSPADREVFDSLYAENEELRATTSTLHALLRKSEWAAHTTTIRKGKVTVLPKCWCCDSAQDHGHTADCALQKALET